MKKDQLIRENAYNIDTKLSVTEINFIINSEGFIFLFVQH
jgi:hypothetical protein